MYKEFVVGYVLSGLAVVLLTIVIVLQCSILKKMSRGGTRSNDVPYTPHAKGNAYTERNRGTAICRNCATQFDAGLSVCPKCGMPKVR